MNSTEVSEISTSTVNVSQQHNPVRSERGVSDRLRRQQQSSEHREQTRQSSVTPDKRARQQQSEEERQQRLLARRDRERSVRLHESEERRQQRLLARRERERSYVHYCLCTLTFIQSIHLNISQCQSGYTCSQIQ